ncbi:MAG TPA: PD-(D/E)XK nuclease family protein [Xanthobacteraceae bacterium]|nr:PD-(D/E)XK nuclease family protein [Xanthobacteraceae bacterium]
MLGPTASSLELARECVWPWCPDAVRVDTSNPDAQFGSAGHEVIASLINGDALFFGELAKKYGLDPEKDGPRLKRICDGFNEKIRIKPGWRAEIAFAYDPDTDRGRELPLAGHRDYSAAGPSEFVGTADLVTMDIVGPMRARETLVEITDWKFGRRDNVTVPASNAQLRFLALAAARTFGVERARVRIGFVDDEGGVLFESSEMDSFEIEAVAAELVAIARRLRETSTPVPRAHCRRCPALVSCPETAAAMVKVAPAPDSSAFPVVADAAAITGPEHAAWLLHRLWAVQKAGEQVESALKKYADEHGGIVVRPGVVWSGKDIPIENIKLTPEAEQLVREVLPEAVKPTVSKKALEEAAHAKKLPIAKTVETVMGRLRVAGAVTKSVQRRYEER